MEQGLHEYLMDFVEQMDVLNEEVNRHFLAPAYS